MRIDFYNIFYDLFDFLLFVRICFAVLNQNTFHLASFVHFENLNQKLFVIELSRTTHHNYLTLVEISALFSLNCAFSVKAFQKQCPCCFCQNNFASKCDGQSLLLICDGQQIVMKAKFANFVFWKLIKDFWAN